MAIEYFTDSFGDERIRKTTSEEVTLNGKNYRIIYDVLKSNFTVGDTTDESAAEIEINDAVYNLINHALVNSYYLTEEQLNLIHPYLEEITE